MKVLGPKETGKGILIEYDAGFISPKENKSVISEMKGIDFSEDIILYAVLQKYDTPNKNGRIYPERLLKREMEKYQEIIDKGSALNELNHPSSSLIDLDRVSHTITETWWDGKILMGKIKLLLSPGWKKSGIVSTKGDQAAMLLMNGVTLGISSRGVGSLKSVKGQNIVQEDFELVCFDLVSSPSTPGAYVFQDPGDREKYEESIEEQPIVDERMSKLMGNLNSFLSK
jgi:hypothetical protein|tara:strand:+ start:766 stop:1449 length:684 start_codon:yes stop_codon:yes gene_type:complete